MRVPRESDGRGYGWQNCKRASKRCTIAATRLKDDYMGAGNVGVPLVWGIGCSETATYGSRE